MTPRTVEDLEVEMVRVKRRVENLIANWKRNRRQTVKLLRELANEVQKDEDNSRIARLAGSSASIVGKHLALGGAVAAFFTFGVSLILSIVGGVIVGAGESTVWGTNIVNDLLRSHNIELVMDALRSDHEETLRIQEHIDKAVEVLKKLNLTLSTKNTQDHVISLCGEIPYTRQLSNERQVAKIRPMQSDKVKTLESKVIRIAGIAFSTVSIASDFSTLISTSVEVHRGSVLQVVEDIRDEANELENAMSRARCTYKQCSGFDDKSSQLGINKLYEWR